MVREAPERGGGTLRKTVLSFAVLLTALLLAGSTLATGAALAESQPDQQQTSSEYSYPVDRWNEIVGQTFTAGASGQLDRVSVHAGCCQNKDQALAPGQPPGDLVVKIHTVDPTTGYPTDVVLGSGREPASSFPTDGSLAWVDVDLSQAPGVEAGKTYAIVVSDTGNGYERWQWYALGAAWRNPYPGGKLVYAKRYEGIDCPPLLSGWQWLGRSHDDIAFKTFVEPGTPNPAPADTTPPDTCVHGPTGLINDDTPTFNFDGSDNVTSIYDLFFSYKVDGGEWSEFSSETGGSATLGGASGLSDGPHTFSLRAKDGAGNEDASPVERSFTVDSTVPTVDRVDPAAGAKGVPRGTDVEVTFSEGMEPCSIDHPRFELYKWNKDRQGWQWVTNTGLSTWLPDVGCDIPPPTTATLDPYPSDPSRVLAKDTKYRVVITTEIRDPAGNRLAQDYAWTFRTKGG